MHTPEDPEPFPGPSHELGPEADFYPKLEVQTGPFGYGKLLDAARLHHYREPDRYGFEWVEGLESHVAIMHADVDGEHVGIGWFERQHEKQTVPVFPVTEPGGVDLRIVEGSVKVHITSSQTDNQGPPTTHTATPTRTAPIALNWGDKVYINQTFGPPGTEHVESLAHKCWFVCHYPPPS